MKNEGLFCLWKYVPKDGGLTKKPINPNIPRFGAKPNNRETFAPFSEVVGKATYGYSKNWTNDPKAYGLGIGLFKGKDMSIGCIDLDHCLDEDGDLSPLAEEVLSLTGKTYFEISPGGDGLHIFFKFRNDSIPDGYSQKGDGIECYLAGRTTRYMTVTGWSYRGDKSPVLLDLSEVLPQILDKYLKRDTPAQEEAPLVSPENISDESVKEITEGSRKYSVFLYGLPEDAEHAITANFNGDHSKADLSFCRALATWTDGNEEQIDRIFRESHLMRDKWDEKHTSDGKTYGQMTIQKAVESYQAYVREMVKDFTPSKKEQSFNDFLARIKGKTYKPYPTGIPTVDELLGGGFTLKSLIVLTAAPSTGKTTLAQQIFETMGADTLFINLEMSEDQLLARSLSRMLCEHNQKVSSLDVLRGYKWDEGEEHMVREVAEKYRETILPHMTYVHPKSNDVEHIGKLMESYAKKRESEGKRAPFVVIDYLHLLRGEGDLQDVIKRAVKMLKDYAINHNSLVFLISATNRNSNKSGDITLESGRDSSAIEYSSDVQIALNHREIYEGKKSPTKPRDMEEILTRDKREMVLQVLKNRMGACGKTVDILFDASHSRFYSPTFAEDDL